MPAKNSPKKKSAHLKVLYFLAFVLALAAAMPAYVESSYIKQFVGVGWVSLFFLGANLATFVAILYFPGIIKKYRNNRTSEAVLFFYFLALVLMSVVQSAVGVFIAFALLIVASTLIWINMDVFVESYSSNSSTGKTRTLFFTFLNLGWIVAPFISSYFIELSGYRIVYLAAALALAIFYVLFIKKNRELIDRNKYQKLNGLETVKKICRRKNLRGIFAVAILLNTFYSLAVIYIPLHLLQNVGFCWETMGLMFSFMLLPFVLFELPAGILADKYWGEKEMLYIGISILFISLLLFFGLDTKNALIWGAVLFFSRIGAALVEAMRETYFFKIVDAEDLSLIDFFRTSIPLGYILGTGLGVLVTLVLPINYIFLVFALIILSGFYFISIIKDTK
ncbi:MAG TPA: MFS transporter [bacterium]|nr:MFS transporter [bacterium]HPT29499.1 MFS transporter [bacterium]